MTTREKIENLLEVSIGFLRPAELGGNGNFYLLGSIGADVEWADGEKENIIIMGRVKITEVKKSIKHLLGIKNKKDDIIEALTKEKFDELIDEMHKGIEAIETKKKLYGRELNQIELCKSKEKNGGMES